MASKSDNWSRFGFATRAVRAGQRRTHEGEHSEAIFTTSSYVFDSAAEAAARFSGDSPGNVYSRFTNPTVRAFEERLAALEEGERCVATASGMSAILSLAMSCLKAGDHVLASRSLFGSTVLLFENILGRFGVTTDFVAPGDLDAWRQGIRPNTRLLFVETPSNPLMEVADIARLAEIAHAGDALLAVDNVLCTPALQQPLRLGADVVVHSATKFLDGQGRCVGGAVVGSEAVVSKVYGFLRTAGPAMSPFNAWVFLKGLETLGLRMQAQSEAAGALAQWLSERADVGRVYYPGLADHPQRELVQRQQCAGGAVLSFEINGGREAAFRFIDATELVSVTANLGDTRSTLTHPATTTHGRLTPEQRQQVGIGEGLLRVAVGLEDLGDLQADLDLGFAAAG
ncbi:MAG: O-succinylhomoserine sulfhydrylase [Gammaproteobacteria bacterium]|nr:O-succinylhomoserine sulfhydrylase [Gammaproteobacteria bacterium]